MAATRTGVTQFVAIFVFIGLLAKIRAICFGLQAWIPLDKRRLIVVAWVFERLHAFVDELVAELGPSDEAEVARYSELFAATTAVADVDREASS